MNCDDDCLAKANANYTCGKLVDVLLLTAGAIYEITRTKMSDVRKMTDRWIAARTMESVLAH